MIAIRPAADQSPPRRARAAALAVVTIQLLVCTLWAAPVAATEPMDVLRANVARGLEILTDPRYGDAAYRAEQRARLCEVAHEMFDARLFSRLALADHWKRFDDRERNDFVDAFSEYLCTYYLARLQERYSDEGVRFLGQEYRNDALALVRVEVDWENARVPIEIRMARREDGWKAFDAVVLGVSALLVYRAQLAEALSEGSPADLIRDLRMRVANSG